MQYRPSPIKGLIAETGLDLQPPQLQPLKISSVLGRLLRRNTVARALHIHEPACPPGTVNLPSGSSFRCPKASWFLSPSARMAAALGNPHHPHGGGTSLIYRRVDWLTRHRSWAWTPAPTRHTPHH